MRFAWIDERPFGYLDDGSPTGCDVSLARAAFAMLDEPFEPIHTTFAELLPGLTDGRWHVSTGMFITDGRSRRAHFTRPIWTLRDGLLTRETATAAAQAGSGHGDTTTPQSLQGYRCLARSGGRLAVLHDQVQAQHALQCGVRDEQLVVLDTYEEASAAVAKGEVEAYASVALAHQQHISAHPGGGLRCVVVPEEEATASLGGFACADAETAAALTVALAALLPDEVPGEPSAQPGDWFG